MTKKEKNIQLGIKGVERLMLKELGECDKDSDLYADCVLAVFEAANSNYKCPWASMYSGTVLHVIERYKKNSGKEIITDLEEYEDVNHDLEDALLVKQDLDNIKLAIDCYLSPREKAVIMARFGLQDGICRTYEEVGKKYNVTKERARQIERKALRKLRVVCALRKI